MVGIESAVTRINMIVRSDDEVLEAMELDAVL